MKNPIIKYLEKNQFITALVLILVGYFLVQIQGILLALFTSYIIMATLSPLVDFLIRYKIPRTLAVLLSFFLVIALLLLLIIPLVPFFIAQIQSLLAFFPQYVNQAVKILGVQVTSQAQSLISSELASLGSNAFSVTQQVFGGMLSLLMVLAVSFYLLIDMANIKRSITNLFPTSYHSRVERILTQIEDKLGAWLRGQILLSISIAFLTWVALTIIGLKFALPLALIAGILEIVPAIGPILSAIPGVIFALNQSPNTTIIVILAYVVVQVTENNILVPRIMERAVGLNPIVIILGIIIAGNLLGFAGALLAVPFMSMLVILFKNLRNSSKR